jgi:hypothetical protein
LGASFLNYFEVDFVIIPSSCGRGGSLTELGKLIREFPSSIWEKSPSPNAVQVIDSLFLGLLKVA